jgi:predicted metal-dependent hydrolase
MVKTRIAQLELPLEFRQSDVPSAAHTCLGGKLVSYIVKRSRRRSSITLTIDEQGLRVGAPWRASRSAIESLLRKHDAWVLKKLAEWQARRAAPRRWEDGEMLMVLGQPLRLTLVRENQHIRVDGERLIVGPASAQRPDRTEKQVVDWLRLQALQCFRQRIAQFYPALAVSEPEISLSNAKTRWGSCHIDGRIRLNWRLIQMPLRLIDYVVAHELAHLKEMNHSRRFWQAVEQMVPEYARRRTEIRTEGHRYLLV